ncbi:MAG: hypothetical protein ACREMZ_17250 [Gemmatimonadales bacterium]
MPTNCGTREKYEAQAQALADVLSTRPGWERDGSGWEFAPSLPPGDPTKGPLWSCEPTAIDGDALDHVYPPSVRFSYYEGHDYTGQRQLTAAEITGIDHPRLPGEAFGVYYDSPAELQTHLEEIEAWRWPTNLPGRHYPHGEVTWEPGPPEDLDDLATVLDGRDGWERHDGVMDGASLAFLWPTWIFLPSASKSRHATTIEPDRKNGPGYNMWTPLGRREHVRFPDAAPIIAALDTVEEWRQNRPPRWISEYNGMLTTTCPRCGRSPGSECDHLVGDAPGLGFVIHAERLPAGALEPAPAPSAWTTPKPGQRPAGRARKRRPRQR